jgi:hypothetical protein
MNNYYISPVSKPYPSFLEYGSVPLRYENLQILLSDVGYGKKVYSNIRHNVGFWALQ